MWGGLGEWPVFTQWWGLEPIPGPSPHPGPGPGPGGSDHSGWLWASPSRILLSVEKAELPQICPGDLSTAGQWPGW